MDTRRKKKHIGFSHFRSLLWSIVSYQARAQAEEMGLEFSIATCSNIQDQLIGIENLLKKKVDALLIVSPVSDDPYLTEAVSRIRQSGIVVIAIGARIGNQTESGFVASDNFNGAAHTVQYLFEKIGRKGKVAHLGGMVNLPSHRLRADAFHQVLSQHPGIDLAYENSLVSESLTGARVLGKEMTHRALKLHDDLRAIVADTDMVALGATDAIEEENLTGKISVIGFDGLPLAFPAILSGKLLATGRQITEKIAQSSIDMALKKLNGENTPDTIITPVELITPDNILTAISKVLEIMPSMLLYVAESYELEQRLQQQAMAAQQNILKTTAAVSNAVSSILQPESMMQKTVDLISDRFDLDYAGLFLINSEEQGKRLSLRASNGNTLDTRSTELPLDRSSLVGSCVLDKRLHATSDKFSELALPLKIGEKIIGALNVQSRNTQSFDDDKIMILQAMAEQVAIALQNANLYAEQESTTRFLNSVIDNIPTILFVKKGDDLAYVRLNKAWEELYGVSGNSLIGKNVYDFYSKEIASELIASDREVLAGGKLVTIPEEIVMSDKRGRRILHTKKIPIPGADGQPKFMLGISEDITERKEAEVALRASEERFRRLTELSSDWYWEQDENLRFTAAGDKDGKGTYLDSNFGKKTWELPYIDTPPEKWVEHKALVEAHLPFYDFELKRVDIDGNIRHVSLSGYPVFNEQGIFKGYSGIGKDITHRKNAEDQVRYLAYHDSLTKLPNRSVFAQRVSHALEKAKRSGKCMAILFIDLDRFKNINDTLGHQSGDQLLVEIANRLKNCLRASDTVARLGGDEFVVLLEEIDPDKYIAGVARKLLAAITQSTTIGGHEFQITASVGITVYPQDGQDEQTLMKNADIAMYVAKDQGKNNFQFYSSQMNIHSFERLALESNLRRALENNEFLIHYQAKIDIKTNRITGCEALIRWQHPDLGLVSPAQFIPIAEETGLIVPIGKLVLRTACAQNVDWQKQGLPPFKIAVNLSPRQFVDENLLMDVSSILAKTRMKATLLELEITESMVMYNKDKAIKILRDLKNLGINLAIDDFGTGYSSFALLKQFPIDSIKIDRSFIKDIPDDPGDSAITDAIIAVGKALNLKIIAEGVETKEQLEFLRDHHCDEMQGFYFSKPIPSLDFKNLFLRNAADQK